MAYDVSGENAIDRTHWVLVQDTQPDSEYFFAIFVNGVKFEDEREFHIRTLGRSQQDRTISEIAPRLASARDLVNQTQTTESSDAKVPNSVKVARPTNSIGEFIVKWKTSTPAKGWIEYGPDTGHLKIVAYDMRRKDVTDTTHWVLVKDTAPDSHYFFAIVIDGQRYATSEI